MSTKPKRLCKKHSLVCLHLVAACATSKTHLRTCDPLPSISLAANCVAARPNATTNHLSNSKVLRAQNCNSHPSQSSWPTLTKRQLSQHSVICRHDSGNAWCCATTCHFLK